MPNAMVGPALVPVEVLAFPMPVTPEYSTMTQVLRTDEPNVTVMVMLVPAIDAPALVLQHMASVVLVAGFDR